MAKPPNVAASRQNSNQLDQTVNLTNYERDNSERMEKWVETSASPHTIPARVDVRNTPLVVATVRESGDADIDGRIHVPDDADGVSNIRDGGGKGASTIDEDQDDEADWRVVVKKDDGGLIRLDVERID